MTNLMIPEDTTKLKGKLSLILGYISIKFEWPKYSFFSYNSLI